MRKSKKLTISILISKRPDTVRKCLDSIKPILEQVDSELILTDTGCGEEVRSIIEEYTDNILDFEWCRDFSKARNLGLKKAKGEWFLFLDDDEWFEDVSDIIEFFNSGKYRNYGIATYYQRNYGDEQGFEYSDLVVGRLIKLESDIQFQYAIHECFNRISGKTKVLNAYVHHYGYVYKSEKDRIAHSERNVSLLLIEHEKDPYNLKHIFQLVQEYNAIEKYKDSLKMALKGIEYSKEKKATETFCKNSFYVNVINCYIREEKYKEIIEVGNKYLEEEQLDELAKAIIYFRLAASYFEIQQYEKALNAIMEYWKRYECHRKNAEIYVAYNTSITAAAFQPGYLNLAICLIVRIYMALKDYKKAEEWLKEFNPEEKKLILTDKMLDEMIDNYYIEQGNNQTLLLSMCNYLLKRKEISDYVVGLIEKKCCEKNDKDSSEVLLRFHELDGVGPFYQMIRFLYKMQISEDVADLTEEMKILCRSDLSLCFRSFIVYKVWDRAKEKGIDLEDVIHSILYSVWDKAVISYCKYQLIGEMEEFHKLLSSILNQDEIHMLSWMKSYYFYKLQKQADDIKQADASNEQQVKKVKIEQLLEDLKVYGNICQNLYSRIYRPEILSIDTGVLPKEGQAGFYIAKWVELREQQKLVEAIEVVKEAKEKVPEWGQIFQICLKIIEEDNQEQQNAQNEFYVLGCQLKRKAKECIQLGQADLAKTILLQLKTMLPEDEEIDSLLAQIQ